MIKRTVKHVYFRNYNKYIYLQHKMPVSYDILKMNNILSKNKWNL